MAEGQETREAIAQASRVLAQVGIVREATGHVSVRSLETPGAMWIRCRGPQEAGLKFTRPEDVHLVGLDGGRQHVPADYAIPNEYPIHSEIYKRRPDVGSVVHAHPRYALLCGVAGVRWEPVFGSYDIEAMRLAQEGVPVYPRSVLIKTSALGRQVAETLGSHALVLLKGHGIAAVGASLAEAMVRAIKFEVLCEVLWQLHLAKVELSPLPPEDLEALLGPPEGRFDLRPAGHRREIFEWTWRHYLRNLPSLD